VNASKQAGIMTHYIADVTVFGHVRGAKTDWGTETHHSDYEGYVQRGDHDSDDQITVADAIIEPHMAVSGAYDDAADMNRNGVVTSVDALMTLQSEIYIFIV
jgi:hypothetical protein